LTAFHDLAPSAFWPLPSGNILADYTQWTTASDLKAKRYYFRAYENSSIRMVDLPKMKLDAKDIRGEVIKPLDP
jgi:penicillin V acylase-like amidase (Ntn superfamily)